MKIQVRRETFETNSSSTHSLQLVNGSVDDAMKYVHDRIIKSYGDKDTDTGIFDPTDYMYATGSIPESFNINIKGINFDDGDENANAYSLVTNWMAKIQYIGMILYAFKSEEASNVKYWAWFEDKWGHNSWNDNYGVNKEYMDDLDRSPNFYTSDTVQWFKEWVKNYVKSIIGINVADVIYDEDTLIYDNCIERTDYNFSEIINDKEKLYETLNNLMETNNIMIYADEAYSPYSAPSIKVY